MKKTRLAGLNLVWFPPITYSIRHYYSYTPQYNADCDIIFGAYELESHESPILSGMMAFTRKETAQYLICNLAMQQKQDKKEQSAKELVARKLSQFVVTFACAWKM